MSLTREVVQDAAVGVAVADTPEGLSSFHKPGCAAAIWRRQPPAEFRDWIEGLAPELLPSMREIMAPADVADAVTEACDDADTPASPARDWLVADIASLAACFADLVSAPYLRVRLDVVTSNSCRKFHIDAVTSRLICTYRGTGTQYGVSPDGAEPRRVFTAPTGAPFLLRGTLWPAEPRSGLLHRSPPIAGTGETRLLLVLDPLNAPAEETDHLLH